MRFDSVAALASIATLATAQTPEGYNVTASTNLPFSFQGSPALPAGQELPLAANRQAPTLALPSSLPSDGTYLVVMVDPDVPSPLFPSSRAEIAHWLQPSVRASDNGTLSSDAEPILPYRPPQPPSVDPHRYILLLYTQESDDFEVPEAFQRFTDEERSGFSALAFQEAAGLGDPVAASYFLSGCEEDCMYPAGSNGTTPGNGTSGGGAGGGNTGGGSTGGGSNGSFPIVPESTGSSRILGWTSLLGAVGVLFAALF